MAVDVILDAGHGGFDLGASYRGRAEKDDVLKLALDVGQKLQEKGYQVYFTRTTDTYQTPAEKAELANGSKGKYFLSFHRNSGLEDNLFHGVQSIVYKKTEENVRLAENLNQALEKVGFKNLGIEEIPELIVLRESDMPGVLLEVGFLNHEGDNQIFDAQYEQIVNGIVDGIQQSIPITIQEKPKNYYVQTGCFRYDVNAAYQLERLEILGYHGEIRFQEPYYSVWTGQTASLEDAVALQNELKRKGYYTLLVAE